MSGIYINGMEMPTRCEDCFCYRNNAEYDYVYCNISSVNVRGHGNARLNNCPLVAVPDHGRLVDADAIDYDDYWWNKHYSARDCKQAEKMINEQPTIIPADKEGEK